MSRPGPIATLALTALCLTGATFVWQYLHEKEALTLTIFHPGKGTAVLVQNPRGATLLVDTGPDAQILRLLGTTLPEWQRSIGVVVLTDASAAVSGGAPDLLARYAATTLLRIPTPGSTAFEAALADALRGRPETTTTDAVQGLRVPLGGTATVEVVWPPPTPTPLTGENGALALMLSYEDVRVLFEESLTPRMNAALQKQRAGLPPPALRISSTTPEGTYHLTRDGVVRIK